METQLMSDPQELIILQSFTEILEQLEIPYAVGGSVASSFYGHVRFTQDVDITVEPFERCAQKFVDRLKSQHYISTEAMHQAFSQRSSFNVIHMESAFKIDIFVRKDTAFEEQLINRHRLLKLSDELDKHFSVLSPEDVILLKLQWYNSGGCISQRQWSDVLGIFEVQAGELDLNYLQKWSANLGIDDLLKKAMTEIK